MEVALIKAAILVVSVVFNFFMFVVVMRFLLQLVKADFYNPFCQFVARLTNPILVPLRKVIPGFFGLDFATILLMYGLELLQLSVTSELAIHHVSPFVFFVALISGVQYILNILFFVILGRAILSWLSPNPYHPFVSVLTELSEPLLARARRVIPMISGIDLSPLIVLLGLQVISILLGGLY